MCKSFSVLGKIHAKFLSIGCIASLMHTGTFILHCAFNLCKTCASGHMSSNIDAKS